MDSLRDKDKEAYLEIIADYESVPAETRLKEIGIRYQAKYDQILHDYD